MHENIHSLFWRGNCRLLHGKIPPSPPIRHMVWSMFGSGELLATTMKKKIIILATGFAEKPLPSV